ncbi:MAG TPA: amino acid ABC transporter substrate-binding protein [Pseudonocardiaceae bacterium]|nr:amino acid ABC transporter substrate-binding protein [Pseudonocardiaceae bacterium]
MRWYHRLTSNFLRGRGGTRDTAVRPAVWPRRHPRIVAAIAVVIVAGAGVAIWQGVSRTSCGSGLEEMGNPAVCVGLDLDSGDLRANDPLADLERRLAGMNKAITGPNFVTIVLLDDFTPDPANDSLAFQNLRHEVQGALTAAWRANHQSVADGTTPPVKLLLASFGSGGQFQSQAVNAITGARNSQHIVAVTGLGQSLDTTRKAASDLSEAHIATIAASTSGDDMNRDPVTNNYIQRFFRITPTNTDAAKAALTYLARRNQHKVMLVEDTNEHDLYATTLGQAFDVAYRARYGTDPYTKTYESPDVPLNDITRATYMTKRFADMRDSICLQQPGLIYFAGRGADLSSFLTVLAQGGACGLTTVDVMSSDDANNMLGRPLPNFGALHVNVLYTAVATGGEWNAGAPGEADNADDYDAFFSVFKGQHFGTPGDLADGYVMTNYDAILTAATAARHDPDPVNNPMTVADSISEFDCQSPVPGVTGQIAFTPASHGNPIDKAMPIVQIAPDGSPHVKDIIWTTGQPFKAASCG